MEKVETGKVYRHFKGNYYFVENVAYDSKKEWLYIDHYMKEKMVNNFG